MKIRQLIPSVFAEGSLIGTHCFLIQFSGCSWNCAKCECPEAAIEETEETSIDKIFKEMRGYEVGHIYLTGGNPLQQDILPLIDRLKAKNVFICLDYNGLDLLTESVSEIFNKVDLIYTDIKVPSSGHEANIPYIKEIYDMYIKRIELRAVIRCREDVLFLKSFQKTPLNLIPIWNSGASSPNVSIMRFALSKIFEKNLPWKVQISQHNIVKTPYRV